MEDDNTTWKSTKDRKYYSTLWPSKVGWQTKSYRQRMCSGTVLNGMENEGDSINDVCWPCSQYLSTANVFLVDSTNSGFKQKEEGGKTANLPLLADTTFGGNAGYHLPRRTHISGNSVVTYVTLEIFRSCTFWHVMGHCISRFIGVLVYWLHRGQWRALTGS